MQKLFLPLLFVTIFITQAKAQQRLFDQPVQMKTCNISIEANSFIATTTIEMEFYNPKDQEVEARQLFELNRGQVITDFYLELDGKYRKGSIEERWKARQAYNSIVGKRIDPALLQMNGLNNYSLNIYPVAAKSSRKIKFIITQMMKVENSKLIYDLPLNFAGNTSVFNLDIKIKDPVSIPYVNKGLLENYFFEMGNATASLKSQAKDITLNKPVSFSINQFTAEPQLCISKQNGKTNFLMRLYPGVPAFYAARPKTINVYWDVSLSGQERNLSKELDYLERYIARNEVDKATIILFNQQLQGTLRFNRLKDNFNSIRNYLMAYKYSGATELGNLNFANVLADRILLFSDGINSVGSSQPKLGAVQVNCIASSLNYNYNHLKRIIGNTGGSVINIYYTDVKNAVMKTDSAENFLFKYNTSHISVNEPFPIRLDKSILLTGTIDQSDNLELIYGNNTTMTRSENYFLSVDENCDEESYKKMQMLKTYDSLMYESNRSYNWQNIIVFGLTEKVVTPQTSYLVLERIEDYINYKIAPPKELEEKCAEMNYVYQSAYKIQALKSFTERDVLEKTVNMYNSRIGWWDKNETLIDLNRQPPIQKNIDLAVNTALGQDKSSNLNDNTPADYKSGGNALQEVVVTSAFGVKRSVRMVTTNVQQVSAEQLNSIRQQNVNNALAGKIAGLQVQSQSAAKLGANTFVRLRGENSLRAGTGPLYVVNGTVISNSADINTDDIEDISVLQGPAAAALFGYEGANGAIMITIKKARRGYARQYYSWTDYKLSSAEDEDYVLEMRNANAYELWDRFLELEKENRGDVGFYFEMAGFFFEKGKKDKAQELMYNAIELCKGDNHGLILSAYMYEQWKWFDKAIAVYKGILSLNENNLVTKRDLALAYFQNKNYEASVKTYYDIITAVTDDHYSNIKDIALTEMNAVLVMNKNGFDISYINFNLVKALPVDLRITIENNYGQVSNPQIIEPGGFLCNSQNIITKNNGRFTGANYWHGNSIADYSIKNAAKGRYRIKVNANNAYSYAAQIPMYVRVITFSNFHDKNMKMEVKLFDLDNQYGVVELDEVSW